jgi:hypothetical protein
MIALPTGVGAWLAAGHTGVRRGVHGRRAKSKRRFDMIHTPAISLRVPRPQRLFGKNPVV